MKKTKSIVEPKKVFEKRKNNKNIINNIMF